MGAQQRRMMPPPDILSDISRHDHEKYDQMSDVISQLSDVLGQRDKMMSQQSRARRTEEEEDAEVMTDVQSCLSYIDGLLATPEMINIPERGTNKVLYGNCLIFTFGSIRSSRSGILCPCSKLKITP